MATGVLCEILKQHFPDVITIIEAQEFSRKAQALMDSFTCYDFATWGEYELSLRTLLEALESGNTDFSSVPNVVYKDNDGTIHVSNKQITEFVDINSAPFADFSDYVTQADIELSKVVFPLEGGRGCHWNQCSFCYMNDGYKYRRKTPERMRYEVQHYIDKYGAQLFYYIDNDVVGHDAKAFVQLLDYYKDIKAHNEFHIDFGEFIARDINADIIRKMCEVGFMEIQIGYESTSDKMLKHINKKSHFAHLILVCKWCFYYGLTMTPQNILRSMPFETDSLILDNIRNLYYLRFLLSNKEFYHSMRELCVVSTSRYFKGLIENGTIGNWDYTPMLEFMVDGFIKEDYRYDVFLMQTNILNPLWKLFAETEKSYKECNYSYSISYNGDACYYTEMQNSKVVKHKMLSDLEQQILRYCDRNVRSSDNIKKEFAANSNEEITLAISKLYEEGIIYVSDTYDEIVSLVSIAQ